MSFEYEQKIKFPDLDIFYGTRVLEFYLFISGEEAVCVNKI